MRETGILLLCLPPKTRCGGTQATQLLFRVSVKAQRGGRGARAGPCLCSPRLHLLLLSQQEATLCEEKQLLLPVLVHQLMLGPLLGLPGWVAGIGTLASCPAARRGCREPAPRPHCTRAEAWTPALNACEQGPGPAQPLRWLRVTCGLWVGQGLQEGWGKEIYLACTPGVLALGGEVGEEGGTWKLGRRQAKVTSLPLRGSGETPWDTLVLGPGSRIGTL